MDANVFLHEKSQIPDVYINHNMTLSVKHIRRKSTAQRCVKDEQRIEQTNENAESKQYNDLANNHFAGGICSGFFLS